MTDLTMQDVRTKFPQYSDMSDDQLASALHTKFYADMPQDKFYSKIGYAPKPAAPATPTPTDTSVGHMALGAAEQAGSAVASLPHAAAHAVADLYNRITGNPGAPDPKLVQMLHVSPGQAGQDFSNTAGNALTSLIEKTGLEGVATSAAGAVHGYMNDAPTSGTQAAVQATAPAVGDIATLIGLRGAPGAIARAPGEIADAAYGARSLMTGEAFDISEGTQPEDVGLTKPNNPPLAPHQRIGNTIAGAEAGVANPKVPLTPEGLQTARAAPGAVMGRVANATPDGPVDQQTLDEVANAGGSGVPVSGTGSIQNIQSLRDNLKTILSAPELTGRQKVDWLQALRTKGYKGVGAQDPGAQEMGEAQLDAANALEGHIERGLPKNGDVSIEQFRDARTALAKNHTVEASLKGNNIDLAALGRIYQRNPNLLTGGLNTLGRYAAENSDVTGLGSRFQEPIDLSKVDLTKPATWFSPITGAASRIMANRRAAAGTEAAETAFRQDPSRFNPLESQPPQPPPGMSAGPMGSPPTPPGLGGGFSLADLLSHGVEQGPPEGLSAGPMGAPPSSGMPFARNASHEAGDIGLAPENSWFHGNQGLGNDLAGVMSQGVPEGTTARTPSRAGGPRLGDMIAGPDAQHASLQPPAGETYTPGQRGLFSGMVENNGSGESAASLEAQSRLSQEKATDSQPFMIDPEGAPRAVAHTTDAVDLKAPKGHLKVQIDPGTGKLSIMDRGGLTLQAARGLLNRYLSLHSGRLGDELGS